MRENIVLIGFMGTGKTTVGRLLAKKFNMKFIDSDDEIIRKTGMSINKIFEKYGEEYFRNLEKIVIEEISKLDGCVIATGGGVVKDERNILNLKKKGLIFHLNGSVSKIKENLESEIHKRPLLNCDNYYEKIKLLLEERRELYKRASDFDINIDFLSSNEVAVKIMEIYNSKKL
ncbi:shikimate kinase [Caminicella sporogenes DSM 14501]|uniref:Shikimate kinase n=1 Tax=Caminicella sporogenes DSM 14501 TaxID=1121266 RepID=A0A1M6LN86_9FIRM|nr:shikimate kinase [Caminicella sporogenes]RKD27888.1 hypothetical protein BET04_02170 [Caminicella sporogenes]SHJ72572.1 shikimate kinase [Caminicella sporogenes DSM 14501]